VKLLLAHFGEKRMPQGADGAGSDLRPMAFQRVNRTVGH
jgi:hypothetical protein